MTALPTDPAGASDRSPSVPPLAPAGTKPGSGDSVGEAEHLSLLAEYIAARTVTPRPDCLIWTGAVNNGGYARARINAEIGVVRVHRLVWEMENGPISDGLTVDHLCRVKTCLNTDHMELVTPAENSRRAWEFRPRSAKPRVRRPPRPPNTCINGHEYTPENTIQESRGRRCKTCRLASFQAHYARQRERRRLARLARESAAS